MSGVCTDILQIENWRYELEASFECGNSSQFSQQACPVFKTETSSSRSLNSRKPGQLVHCYVSILGHRGINIGFICQSVWVTHSSPPITTLQPLMSALFWKQRLSSYLTGTFESLIKWHCCLGVVCLQLCKWALLSVTTAMAQLFVWCWTVCVCVLRGYPESCYLWWLFSLCSYPHTGICVAAHSLGIQPQIQSKLKCDWGQPFSSKKQGGFLRKKDEIPFLSMWFDSCGKHFYASQLEGVGKKGARVQCEVVFYDVTMTE